MRFMNINIIMSILVSYLVTLGINRLSNYYMFNMIIENGYCPVKGDIKNLFYELERPNYRLSEYLVYIPYINILITMLESMTNILDFEVIFKELSDMEIISKFNDKEIERYENNDGDIGSIIKLRKEECLNKENYYIYENSFKKEFKKDSCLEKLDIINNSDFLYEDKIFLLGLLKFDIINNISLDYLDMIIGYMRRDNSSFVSYYRKIFEYRDYYSKEDLREIIIFLNKIMEDNNIDMEKKIFYIRRLYEYISLAFKSKEYVSVSCKDNDYENTIIVLKRKKNKNRTMY